MSCPSRDFLLTFATDPDTALAGSPGFEDHLELCPICRKNLDEINSHLPPIDLLTQVLAPQPSFASDRFPEIRGYRISERVGVGGFGTVFRAIQTSTGRLVAIKVLPHSDQAPNKRLTTELETLLRVDHPNIVSLLDAGKTTDGTYFAYPWMDTNLSTFIRYSDTLTIDDILALLIPICEAVCHLHELSIIHRDLKPSNILLTTSKQPKLTDFGIAKDLANSSPSSTMTEAIGTPGYMAPEQTGLANSHVGFHTDVYGLGALMYSMTTGHPPFQGSTAIQIIQQVIINDPIPLRRLRPDLPVDFETVCLKCLNKSPSDRYSSAKELLADLKRLKSGQRISARPLGPFRKTKQWLKHRPFLSSMVIASTILVVLATLWYSQTQRELLLQREIEQTRLLVERLMVANGDDLPTAYSKLREKPINIIDQALKDLPTHSAVENFRLSLIHQDQPLDWPTFRQGVEESQVQDLIAIKQQLHAHKNLKSFDSDIRAYLRSQNDGEQLLKMLSLFDSKTSMDLLDEDIVARAFHALEIRNSTEFDTWQTLLNHHSSYFTTKLLEQLSKRQPNAPLSTHLPLELSLLWNIEDPKLLTEIVELAGFESLDYLRKYRDHLPRSLLEAARENWQRLLEFEENNWQIEPISAEMREFLAKHDGAATDNGGYLLNVDLHAVDTIFRFLNEHRYCVQSAHSSNDPNLNSISVCFKKSPSVSELSLHPNVGDFREAVSIRSGEAWQLSSASVTRTNQLLCVWNRNADFRSELIEWDPNTESKESLIERQTSEADASWSEFEFSGTHFLISRTAPATLSHLTIDAKAQAKIRLPPLSSEGRPPAKATSIFSSIGPRNLNRIVTSTTKLMQFAVATSRDDFRAISNQLFQAGFQPTDVLIDTPERYAAIWEMDFRLPQSVQHTRAVFALLCCLFDEYGPLLAELKTRPLAFARGYVIHHLPSLEKNPSKLLALLPTLSDPDQINGLLIALGKYQWEDSNGSLKPTLQQQLRTLVLHSDSGVHFAAKWLLETKLHEVVQITDLQKKPVTCEHRSWFYSSSGIPFIVINPTAWQLINDDDKTPWQQTIHSNMVKPKQPYAISATEVTRELYDRCLGLPATSNSQLAKSPILRVNYVNMLQFCRKLSELEKISLEKMNLPESERLGEETVWGEDFLSRDGYRLPTAVEWEIACRCQTTTPTFFGDIEPAISTYAWTSHNTELSPMPVSRLAPNPWGLHDVLGNVYEATLGSVDACRSMIYPDGFPDFGLKYDMAIHVRGGSFLSHVVYCKSGSQHGIKYGAYDGNTGFRVVIPLNCASTGD